MMFLSLMLKLTYFVFFVIKGNFPPPFIFVYLSRHDYNIFGNLTIWNIINTMSNVVMNFQIYHGYLKGLISRFHNIPFYWFTIQGFCVFPSKEFNFLLLSLQFISVCAKIGKDYWPRHRRCLLYLSHASSLIQIQVLLLFCSFWDHWKLRGGHNINKHISYSKK